MQLTQNQPSHRKIYMDFLRILAMLLVLFNHTNTRGYALCINTTESVMFPLYLACSAFCKIAVPIFLMISGALLLKKDETVSVILRKRFLRIFLSLVLASGIMYIYLSHRFGTELSLSGFLVELYSTNITTALWYLYAYLAFLLMLPFLRRISRSAQEKDYLYLTSLMAFVGLLRTAELLLFDYKININSNFDLHIVSQIIYYPLIGDYLANKLPDSKLTKRNVVLITLIGVVGLIINCLLTVRWCTVLGKWEYSSFERHIARFVFLPTISVFVGVKYLFMHIRLSETANRAIAYIGSCTFGIYLFERIYRTQTIRVYTVLDRYLPRLVACLIWVFVAFVAGLAVTTVLKKIPLLKKLI